MQLGSLHARANPSLSTAKACCQTLRAGLLQCSFSRQLRLRKTLQSRLARSRFTCRNEPSRQSLQCILGAWKGRQAYLASNPHRQLSTQHMTDNKTLPSYEAPSQGVLSFLPRAAVPYAELSRLDKPAGTIYLFFPCAFSTLLAAPLAYPAIDPLQVCSTTALFLSGALIMRGAGCTINDLWDRNLDPQVSRTRLRPIARGAIELPAALVYTCAQLLAGLTVLLQFPHDCLWYGIPSLALVTTYPLAKRVTDYPQVVLGLAFSWGAIMGFPALGIDLMSNSQAMQAAALLYSSCVSWTVLYDMIYAHMDIRDDVKAGIKSIALRHESNTKTVLTGLAVVQISLLAAAGASLGAGPIFFAGSCGGAATTLGIMIWRVRLRSAQDCWWWFRNGCWFTGGAITLGLVGEYFAQTAETDHDSVDSVVDKRTTRQEATKK